MAIPKHIKDNISMPVIGAPLFLISGPDIKNKGAPITGIEILSLICFGIATILSLFKN